MNTTQRTLYLLHYAAHHRGTLHYLGITRSDRLATRLTEHERGKGSKTTAAVLRAGINIYLARTWRDATFQDEQRIKKNGHFKNLCPICRPGIAQTPIPTTMLIATPRVTTNRSEQPQTVSDRPIIEF